MTVYQPAQVIPALLAEAVAALPGWFVIGGQAVRCLCPYRPSRDTDFGVENARDLDELIAALQQRGETEILERTANTVHLRWTSIKMSAFVLPTLRPYVEDRRLGVKGILATKMHAVVDRGLRRDFFDLYVVMQSQQLGLNDCLAAVRAVYGREVQDGLLLRALTYFDDADREASLPGEGPHDFATVKDFFLSRVGGLLVPPRKPLAIQAQQVDVHS